MRRTFVTAAATIAATLIAAGPVAADMVVFLDNQSSSPIIFRLGEEGGGMGSNVSISWWTDVGSMPFVARNATGMTICEGAATVTIVENESTCTVQYTINATSPRCVDTFAGNGTARCTVTVRVQP